MKVIELLTKIANGEEVPTIIKYKHNIWAYRNDVQDYTDETQFFFGEYIFQEDTQKELNYEVEIIEEDKGISKDIKWYLIGEQEKEETKIAQINMNFRIMREKIAEIIDKINEDK